MRACLLLLAVLACLGVWPKLAAAQTAPEAPRPAASPPVEASQLDTFLMRDSKGNLVPVLGLSFEEFEQLLRAKKGLAAPPTPSYTLESLSLVGTAGEQIADLQLIATIRVREAGWVRVPLLIPTAVVREASKHEGPGEHFLAYDETAGGYVCWLNGNDARPHVVTVPLSVGLTSVGEERRLSLALPRATESSLRLTTPEAGAIATLTGGDGIVSTRASGGERTEISVLGPAGEMQLSWRPKGNGGAATAAQLDTSGEIAVRIQSERRITSEARLRVRSFGAALETFRVRLPRGMEWISLAAPVGYTVAPLNGEQDEATADEPTQQTVEVRLDKPTTGVAEVLLRVQLEADSMAAGISPAQFEVLGAARQRGTIDFVVDGEWQLDWTDDNSVHRVDTLPDGAANVAARYEYFRQPCGLVLKVSPRPSRITVEPSHTVFIDAERLRVETILKYRFRGARATGLSFELGDWTLDRLTPDGLLDVPIMGTNSGELQVPFRTGTTPVTELELKLEGHRTLGSSDRLAIGLPQPIADFVAPATIVISAADNIELTPRGSELVGMVPDPAAVRLAGRQQSAAVYRDLGGGERALFVAGVRRLTRVTTTSTRARLRFERQQAHVEQTLEYRIAHEPQRTFVLTVPRGVVTGGSLQVSLNGEPLPTSLVPGEGAADQWLTRWQFSTPSDQIGTFQVVVRHSLPLAWDRKAALSLTIPHVLPAEEENSQFTGQQVEFVLLDGSTIEPDLDDVDELAEPIAVGSGSAHTYSWSSPASVSYWTVEAGQETEPTSVSVGQMWVQTWLSPEIRQERVVLRMTTTQEAVRVRLPRRVRQASVQTAIDGREVENSFRMPGQVVVAMPPAAQGRECVLEVWYALDPPEQNFGLMSDELRPAQVDQSAAPRRVYWQVVLPEDLHVVVPPRELAAEMTWTNRWPARWLVGRRPIMDQAQLEAWIKASRQESLPLAANEYLYGGLGRWPTLSLVTAQRRIVVGVASGCMLALGLLLMHVRQLRRPGVLLAGAVVLAGLALAAPELGLLAAQGALIGVLVMAVAAVWSWLASGRATSSAPAVHSTAARAREGSSMHGAGQRPDRSSHITTTAGPGPLVEARP